MAYVGDFTLGDTFDVKFTTVSSAGAPTTLSGTPVVSAYVGNSTTQITAGITLSVDFDSVTGLNNVRVVATSGNGYATASNYALVITTGTVDGSSVVGYTVAEFSIGARSVASVTGAVGSVTGNVGGIAGTIQTLDALDTAQDTQHASTRTVLGTPAGADLATDIAALPTAAENADAVWDEVITGAQHNVNNSAAKFLRESAEANALLTGTAQAGGATTITLASGAVTANDILNGERVAIIEGTGAGQSRLIIDSAVTTDIVTVAHAWTTNPDNTSVYAIMGAEADVRAIAEQSVTATASVDFDDMTSAVTADAVWDEVASGHATAGTTGALLAAAGGAADPLLNSVPGAYSSGTAGFALGSISGIKAKTDLITSGTSVTLVSPVSTPSNTMTVEQGDDYASADGRAFQWSITSAPDLTGATVVLNIENSTTTYDASVTDPGESTQIVVVELTDTETAAMTLGRRQYEIEATLSGGNVVSLVRGTIQVNGSF